ncbi:MAG: tyrosine-type recombinase/integrase [Coriobacteriia bacterium]
MSLAAPRRLKNGKTVIDIKYRDRRNRTSLTVDCNRKAIKCGLDHLLAARGCRRRHASPPGSARITVAEVAKSWFPWAESHGWRRRGRRSPNGARQPYSKNTLDVYAALYNAHIARSWLASRPIAKVNGDDLDDFLVQDLAAVSLHSREKLRHLLSRIWEYAEEAHYVRDTSAVSDLPGFVSVNDSAAASQDDFLLVEEVERLLLALPMATTNQGRRHLPPDTLPGISHPEHYLVHLLTLFYTGLRISELAAVVWSRVRLSNQPGQSRIEVASSLYDGPLGRSLERTKTGAGTRAVYIPDALADELRRHRIHQYDHAKGGVRPDIPGSPSDELVFTTPRGYPLNVTNFRNRIFRRVAAHAGFDRRLHPHVTRHTWMTHYASSVDGNARLLAAAAGHTGLQSSARYLGASEDMKSRASAKYADIMRLDAVWATTGASAPDEEKGALNE